MQTQFLFKIFAIAGLATLPFAANGGHFPAAHAQLSPGYQFLKAVKDRDGQSASDLIEKNQGSVLNARDITSGETAMHIVVERRDTAWMRYLLQEGADPNISNNKGESPLMLATMLGFVEGAELLLADRNNSKIIKANVDITNMSGETPLIRAVQMRNLQMVRLFLENGADPDKVDSIAGMSARDYATRDRRSREILDEIEKNDSRRKGKSQESKSYGPVFK